MATTKKKASVSRRRKTTAKALGSTKKFNGKTYTKKACSKSKTDAKKTADRKRKMGYKARVVKDNVRGTWCVFQAGRKKAKRA